MRKSVSRPLSHPALLALILLPLVLGGCAGKPEKTPDETSKPSTEKQQPRTSQGVSLTLPSSKYSGAFNSAEQSLAQFDWMAASVALQALPEQGLSIDDSAYRSYLQARIDYIRGEQQQALAQLDRLNSPAINPALRYRILSFKHYILDINGESLASAQLADQIMRMAPDKNVPAWKRNVWRNLEKTNADALSAALVQANDPQWRGWLNLALISRSTPATLPSQLTQWRSENANHPAARPLPGGYDYMLAQGQQSGKVAILLPLSGKLARAGKAVLNGYLAAYYENRSAGGPTDELLIIDLDKAPSASSAYQEAARQGATIVVGPLSKEDLADLATLPERPVPILALNRIDQVLPASGGSALVQLSLAPEDDAQAIAELAFGTGARRALIISPAGEWGEKVEPVLRERWTALGGSIADSVTYTTYDDYSSSVKSLLSLSASEARARELRDLLGTNIEFAPRRRQDADVIFLLSRTSTEARSIKPILAFHYAGDIPVYALSTIYSGVPDQRDQDLNGILLAGTPWLLGDNPELRATLTAGDAIGSNLPQLNALGADAFLVQSGFSRLQSGADALFRGNTGLLTMDPDLSIQRELSAATFDGGALKAQ
ncbi:Penicillin-binding protein activator LpoA [Halioglobus japonicus]|nr:Penicillin-binding protein activator LpoA [Halioglobus japonicus]